jgi:hypothetical protein
VSFLPALTFPFVKLLHRSGNGVVPAECPDSTVAFELVATLLLNWSRHWFEMFPHPPLRFLQRFAALLEHHDPELAAHLARWDGGVAAVAWDLLASLLTDVLGRQEWLKVRTSAPGSHAAGLASAAAVRCRHGTTS